MASDFKNGVSFYAKYAIDPDKFSINFPEGITRCASCDGAYSDTLGRARCRFSKAHSIIEQPLNYPELPDFCPLIPTGEIIGTKPKSARGAK